MQIPHPTSSPVYPEATVMGTTTTLPTAPEEGLDPSCTGAHLLQGFKGYPRAPAAVTPHRSGPTAPSHHVLSSYLPAACPAPWVAADPRRGPGVPHGGPQPQAPTQRPVQGAQDRGHGIARAGTHALGQAGGRHAAAKGIREPGVD